MGVVILAVNVGADRPANRDLPRSRVTQHPQISKWKNRTHQLIEADSCVEVDDPECARIDMVNSVEGGHVHDEPARVLRR